MAAMPVANRPLPGRAEVVDEFVDGYADGDLPGVLFTGPAGIGKSAVVGSIVARLAAAGPDRPVVQVHPTAALTNVSFGALFPVCGTSVAWPPDPTELFEQLRPRGATRLIVAVADVPLLDDASLGLLTELVAGHHAYVLGTARDGLELPDAARPLERSHGWRARRLEALDPEAIQAMAEQILGGPLARGAALRLWERTGGSPLFARQLVEAALAAQAVRRTPAGVWELVAPVAPGARLADLVEHRLGRLDDDARRLVDLLAVAEPLTPEQLGELGVAAALDASVADGTVSIASGEVRLSHPVYADVLTAELGVLERRRLLRDVIDALGTGGSARDAIRIAEWQLAVGDDPDPVVLVAGARHARQARDMPTAALLAGAALDHTGSPEMRRVLAEALMRTGRPDAADELIEAAPAGADGEAAAMERARLVGVQVCNRLWFQGDPGRARAALDAAAAASPDGPASELLAIHAADVLLFEGRTAASCDLLEQARPWAPDLAPQRWLSLAQARSSVGLGDGVLAAAEAARAALAAATAPELCVHPALFDIVRARGSMFTGDLAGARALLAEVLDRPAVRCNPFPRAAALVTVAEVASWQGRVDAARGAADEAAAAADATRDATVRAIAFGQLAAAVGQSGDAIAAKRLLGLLSATDLPSPVGSDAVARGTAWAHVALGHPERARQILQSAADAARARGESWSALWLLVDIARLGAAAEVRDTAIELAAPMTGALAAALTGFVQALTGRSAAALDTATEQLTAIGADLLAAEAATALAAAYRRAGRRRPSGQAEARAAELAARCSGARTPGLVTSPAAVQLSGREREVAQLAERGLTNAEIASRLELSVHTVGNHLHHAYTKLGVSSRGELRAVFDAE